jgi:hypothetical protein
VLVHLPSGKVYRFAYGTSVLHAGGAVDTVDAVTVMMLAESVGVTVVVVVLVIVVVDVKVVRARVVVLMEVLVTVITRGQLAGLTQPPGQTWLSAI